MVEFEVTLSASLMVCKIQTQHIKLILINNFLFNSSLLWMHQGFLLWVANLNFFSLLTICLLIFSCCSSLFRVMLYYHISVSVSRSVCYTWSTKNKLLYPWTYYINSVGSSFVLLSRWYWVAFTYILCNFNDTNRDRICWQVFRAGIFIKAFSLAFPQITAQLKCP